ncbi:hypothetical protein N8J89_24960 [Crossiella sp. CA-258035]|uniref:hypothetical protein n=1 Tax=Crossiella sp. CA-258035 TaxID=2981138 RepID=UPI0024BD5AB8|nr:hypothetical protein [Crossiella sp. CA-258035]WHT16381.1 hypothetical protein N8J89_24960 [Crossiella sp. CA-258035]
MVQPVYNVAESPPAAAAPDCTWQVSQVTAPDGYDPAYIQVTGVDGKGNYSGYYASSSSPVLVRWQQGVPHIQAKPAGMRYATSGDMNAAGVQVVNGLRPGSNVSVPLTHSPETGYRELPVPPGMSDVRAVAIADNGDVVGDVRREDNRRNVAVHWPASGTAPVVIDPPSLLLASAYEIEDDGTVLLGGGYNAAVWRDGQLIAPAEFSNGVLSAGLVNGKVYGTRLRDNRTWVWDVRTGTVTYREGASSISAVNRHGLIAGQVGDSFGPVAVWQDTRFLGELPLPAGATEARVAKVADDNTVFGHSIGERRGALRWHCA